MRGSLVGLTHNETIEKHENVVEYPRQCDIYKNNQILLLKAYRCELQV